MKISPININSIKYNNYVQNRKNINFEGGYKDIVDEWERKNFEKHLNEYIEKSKTGWFSGKKQDVKVGDYNAQMSIFKNRNYVLSSKSNQIKAVMSGFPFYDYCARKTDDFYSKNKGAFSIVILFSKGKGAGSFLVKEAVKKSKEMGFDGRVVLFASALEKAAGCPVPFYHKLGFVANSKKEQTAVEKGMKNFYETGIYNGPECVDMHLAQDRIKDFLD